MLTTMVLSLSAEWLAVLTYLEVKAYWDNVIWYDANIKGEQTPMRFEQVKEHRGLCTDCYLVSPQYANQII